MYKSSLLLASFILLFTLSSKAQTTKLPSLQLKDLEGNTIDTGKLNNDLFLGNLVQPLQKGVEYLCRVL